MIKAVVQLWNGMNLSRQFMLVSLGILVVSMLGVGWWVGRQIEESVVHHTAATTAMYVDSFISPEVQELGDSASLSPERMDALGGLLRDTPMGQQIVAFKVWNPEGRVLFTTGPSTAGLLYPVQGGLARALSGEVAARVSQLEDDENVGERSRWSHLLEIYSPVRLKGSSRIIAVAEFYQTADELDAEKSAAQLRSWLVVGLATLGVYLLLVGIVRRGSDTILRQQNELNEQVGRLTLLLEQNRDLGERVRRAANRAAELNEQYLRRISAELHDGPAQDLSLSLLRLDNAMTLVSGCPQSCPLHEHGQYGRDLDTVQFSISRALQEVRAICIGLRLPELEKLTLRETIGRVVRVHERRTGSRVTLLLDCGNDAVTLPVKITLYRIVQEALSNAYRHGNGVDQQVAVECADGQVRVEISDRGPGFVLDGIPFDGQHLGLAGMRERVVSLGGLFRVDSVLGGGTRVIVVLPAEGVEEELPLAAGEVAR